MSVDFNFLTEFRFGSTESVALPFFKQSVMVLNSDNQRIFTEEDRVREESIYFILFYLSDESVFFKFLF